jgi:5'(3')-deoxyribonucleotidase
MYKSSCKQNFFAKHFSWIKGQHHIHAKEKGIKKSSLRDPYLGQLLNLQKKKILSTVQHCEKQVNNYTQIELKNYTQISPFLDCCC